MHNFITLRRGLDLRLSGEVTDRTKLTDIKAESVAIVPDDFPGLTPKVTVKPGEEVKAGQAIICDKMHPEIAIVATIGGTVSEVVRGERRKVMRIVINADQTGSMTIESSAPAHDEASIRRAMMESGVWAMMRQLPYDIVPDATAKPRDIFVTAFDSAPLATSLLERVEGKGEEILAAIDALLLLTAGKIYIGVRSGEETPGWIEKASAIERVCVTEFGGKHPVGLASVQAAAQAPVNKGEIVWLTDIENLARIGSVVKSGRCEWLTTVALTGSEVKEPQMIVTTVGAAVAPLLAGRLKEVDHHQRVIAGNVLTGINIGEEGYLRYPYRQLTVIPEGDDRDEFMGWASLSPNKMSESRSFVSKLFGRKKFTPDARLNGGRRAMIMSGEYDKVFPMDILPEYLIKAIIARDIDKMEALGIYEVTPADFALCEYVDASKLELQKIVREGLDYLRKELS